MSEEKLCCCNHKPVCVKCQVELRNRMSGVGVLDIAQFGPYKVWDADLYYCPSCGFEVVIGFGVHAIAHHHEEGFTETLNRYRARTRLIESR